MRESGKVRALTAGLLALSLGLLAAGSFTSRSVVYDAARDPDYSLKPAAQPADELWPPRLPVPPEPREVGLSDLRLVENATFTGVTRKDGGLFFTYDPAKKRGKRSCPT